MFSDIFRGSKKEILVLNVKHDGGHYHVETTPLICRINKRTGFYMIGASVMKELKLFLQ